ITVAPYRPPRPHVSVCTPALTDRNYLLIRPGHSMLAGVPGRTITDAVASAQPPGESSPLRNHSVAAFFDLDKTIIAGSSTLAFSGPLRDRGLIGRRALLRSG